MKNLNITGIVVVILNLLVVTGLFLFQGAHYFASDPIALVVGVTGITILLLIAEIFFVLAYKVEHNQL